jgi:hypothetical protein
VPKRATAPALVPEAESALLVATVQVDDHHARQLRRSWRPLGSRARDVARAVEQPRERDTVSSRLETSAPRPIRLLARFTQNTGLSDRGSWVQPRPRVVPSGNRCNAVFAPVLKVCQTSPLGTTLSVVGHCAARTRCDRAAASASKGQPAIQAHGERASASTVRQRDFPATVAREAENHVFRRQNVSET